MGRRLGEPEILGPIARFFKSASKNPSKQSLVKEKLGPQKPRAQNYLSAHLEIESLRAAPQTATNTRGILKTMAMTSYVQDPVHTVMEVLMGPPRPNRSWEFD